MLARDRGLEAAELLRRGIELNTAYTGGYRIYVPDLGPYDVVVIEWEYETLEEMRAAWKAWGERPEAPEMNARWDGMQAWGGHGEIWNLVAER